MCDVQVDFQAQVSRHYTTCPNRMPPDECDDDTSESSQDFCPEDNWQRACERAWTALVRGALAGVALRGGLHVISLAFATFVSRSKRGNAARGGSERHPLEETSRYAAFLGSLGGLYVAVDEGIALLWGKKKTAKWRAFVAGCCAGPSILWTGCQGFGCLPFQRVRVQHNSLSLYIFLRGLTLLIRCGNKSTRRRWLHMLLAPTRMVHGDTLIMCLSCAQILYSFVMIPHTMPKSYVNFIVRHANKPPYVWRAMRELVAHNAKNIHPTAELLALKGTGHLPVYTRSACDLLHPGQSCIKHIGSFVPSAYMRALPVYFPVYIIPAILVHRKRLLTQPFQILPRVLMGTLRSSAFLAISIGCVFAGTCGVHYITRSTSGASIAFAVSSCGLGTLVEKKSRRMELALYCLCRAVGAFFECLVEFGVLKKPNFRFDIVLFSLACGAIMHCYSDGEGEHRDTFRSKYLNVLDFVYGNTGLGIGHIRHIPSNQDLLQSWNRGGWFT